MNQFPKLSLWLLLIFLSGRVFSQDSSVVKFSFQTQRVTGNEVILSIKGKIAPGIQLFALQKSPSDILYSTIHFDSSVASRLGDSLIQKEPIQKANDPSLQSEVYFFTDSVEWQQKIKALPADSFLVKGAINYMYKEGDEYLPGEEEFQEFILPQTSAASINKEDTHLTETNDGGTVAT